MKSKISLVAVILLSSGCSVISNEAIFEGVQGNVQQHLGAEVLRINSKEKEPKPSIFSNNTSSSTKLLFMSKLNLFITLVIFSILELLFLK